MKDERVAILRNSLYLRSEQFIVTQARAILERKPILMLSRDKIINDVTDLPSYETTDGTTLSKAHYHLAPEHFLEKTIRDNQISVLHAHFGVEGELSLRSAMAAHIPHFTTLHGFDVSRKTDSLLLSRKPAWLRYGARRSGFLRNRETTFVCVSEHVRQQALGLGAAEDRLKLVYNGIDLATLHPTTPAEEPRILHIARLVEKKGTIHLLHAMKQVLTQVPEVVLEIVGDGPLRGQLEAAALALGVSSSISFRGELPNGAVIDAIRRCRVLCVPSVRARNGDQEGLPQVILEAAALGRSTVGTQHSGIPEAVIDGYSGFVVQERDEGELAAALISALRDPGLAETMGARAREMAERKFDVRQSAQQLVALYAAESSGNQ